MVMMTNDETFMRVTTEMTVMTMMVVLTMANDAR